MPDDIESNIHLEALDYHSILDSAPDAMVMVDIAGKILFVNKQAETIFGYQREELTGRQIEILVPDEVVGHHPNLVKRYLEQAVARNLAEGMELQARLKNGSTIPVAISLSPIQSQGGMLVMSAIRDLTETKRAERVAASALATSEAQFRHMFESMSEVYILADLTGHILRLNPAAVSILA